MSLLFGSGPASAAPLTNDYGLTAIAVAEGVYVFAGRSENFSRENGGNILNTGFIVGTQGVIVIDSGPSRRYGEQQRAAIARVTPLPIIRVYITHAHPDHFLGNQAYAADALFALPDTAVAIRNNGEALSNNLYRMVGGWMADTVVAAPTGAAAAGEVYVAGRHLKLVAAAGHTDADLMILDEQTHTLFAGDLIFHDRAPTTPDANLARWLAALDDIERLDVTTFVPGHGAVVKGPKAVVQTRDYLEWLGGAMREAEAQGLDMAEVMSLPLPERFRSMPVATTEYVRSVSHLYPALDLATLPPVATDPSLRP